MVTRVIVNGSQGKMGTLACETLEKHSDFILVGQLTKQDNLARGIRDADAQVVLDLTRADCVYDNTLTIIAQGAHPVIGSSGLMNSQIQELTALCEKKGLGGVIAPNFSIGAVLMMV